MTDQENATPEGDDAPQLDEEHSWARVLQPKEPEKHEPVYLVCWGRFWGTLDDLTAAYYMEINTESEEIETLRVAIFGDFSKLEQYNPRLDPKEFENRLMGYSVSDVPVPQITLNDIRDTIQEYLTEGSHIDALREVLEEESESNLKLWAENLFTQLVDQGEVEFHLTGWLTNQTDLSEGNAPETSEESEEDEDGQTTVQVNFINSPMGGKFPEELSPGDRIQVRIVGSAVEKLPDYMRDDEEEKRSIPVESWVESVEKSPDLPQNFDGESENYYKITTELKDNIFGQGLVYKNERLKTDDPGEPSDVKAEDIYPLLILVACLLVIFLLLFLG